MYLMYMREVQRSPARSHRTIALCVIGTVLLWVIPLAFPLLMATGLAMVPKLAWLITLLIVVLLSSLLLARRLRVRVHPLLALFGYPAAWTSAA